MMYKLRIFGSLQRLSTRLITGLPRLSGRSRPTVGLGLSHGPCIGLGNIDVPGQGCTAVSTNFRTFSLDVVNVEQKTRHSIQVKLSKSTHRTVLLLLIVGMTSFCIFFRTIHMQFQCKISHSSHVLGWLSGRALQSSLADVRTGVSDGPEILTPKPLSHL